MTGDELVARIAELGLLPLHDSRVESVTALIAGAPIPGTWWSHPMGHQIFNTIEAVSDRDDIEIVKLLGGKLTMVHRRLWLALLAVATSDEEWQRAVSGDAGGRTLARIEDAGSIRAGALGTDKKVAESLAARLAVFSTSIHTESGRHEKVFESWASWKARHHVAGRRPPLAAAKSALEDAARPFAPLRLPWQAAAVRVQCGNREDVGPILVAEPDTRC